MEREQFLEQVALRRAAGKSIRAIALELDVHRSSVERALKNLRRAQADDLSPSLDQARPQDRVGKEVFVGRHREVGELKAALDDSLSGQGGIVMLVGEPGIGKTRTARELAAYATLKGAQVLWGRCHSTEGAPPYWPWVQVIRAYAEGYEAEELRSQMGPGAADIAEIVPQVRECLPDLQPPPALEPQQARFRLFDSIRAFLKKASQSQPLMLVLDNLHWADRSSLLLLEFLAQELAEGQILVLGTYRDTELTRRHPLTQTLGELAREPLFRRVLLRGLNEAEVGRFIQVNTAFTPSKDLVGAVYWQTEGNPLFVTEVVRLLAQEGKLSPEPSGEHQPWNIMIPVGVREVIGRRLDRLSEGCNDVLTVASVIGREFELDLLEKLMVGPSAGSSPGVGDGSGDSLSGDELLEAVEEALGARVIEEIPQTVSRYQFAHVLIQDTLTQELSAARRARLHRRIGDVLEELYRDATGVHAAQLAYHFAEADTVLGTEKVVKYSLVAGEQALAHYAWEEALVHFQRALDAKESGPMDAETAALLFGLARAQLATSDRFRTQTTQEPAANLRRAFDYYAEAGEVDQAVVVAEHPVQSALGVPIGESELITRALALVPANSHYVGRLLSTYGLSLYQETGDYDGAQEAFGRALEIARREQDLSLDIRTLAHAADVDFHHLSWQEVLSKGQQVIELTRSAEDLQAEATAHFFMARVLDYQGDPGRAQQQAEVLLAQAERLRGRGFLSYALYITGVLSLHRGDWQAARDFLDRSLGLMPQSAPHLCARAVLEYQPGDFLLGQGHVDRLLEATRRSAMGAGFAWPALGLSLIAYVTRDASQFEHARTMAEAVLSLPVDIPLYTAMGRAALALQAIQQHDAAAASEHYDALKAVSGIMLLYVSTDRVLALLAQTMEKLDLAMAHFEDALAFCHQAGYRPELAWTCHDYADALVHRNGPGDHAKALSLLNEALNISSELGMQPLAERVAARQEGLEQHGRGDTLTVHAYPDGLTQREVEVLQFIAGGKSNSEIAEVLVLSVRTVERHITNIYAKINARGRADATSYALGHGLTH